MGLERSCAFQGKDGFDLPRYTQFADNALAPMGFSEAQIEELVADQIALEKLKKILSAGVSVPESEMKRDYEQAYAKMDVSVVRFRSEDFDKDAQVSDDQIAKYFESQKAQLQTEEKRKIKFVQFGLTDEQKKLTGKQRIDVLQKLADQANEFTEALQAKDADFDQVVTKFHLTAKETGEFTQAAPDPQLAGERQLVPAAFALTKDAPNTDAIQTSDGFDLGASRQDRARPSPHPRGSATENCRGIEKTSRAADGRDEGEPKSLHSSCGTISRRGKSLEEAASKSGSQSGEDSGLCLGRYTARRHPGAQAREKGRKSRHAVYQIDREQLEPWKRERLCQHTELADCWLCWKSARRSILRNSKKPVPSSKAAN